MRALIDRRFLVALAVLIVNDRFAKAEWPGFATGKISDVAGPIVAAVLGAVVLRLLIPRWSVSVSMGAVAALMIAIKTSTGGAEFVESVLGLTGAAQSIVVDPTDLVGLLGLAIVPSIVANPTPLVRGRLLESKAMKTTALGIAAFACVATSELETASYDSISVGGDRIAVVDSTREPSNQLVSSDGGQTWTHIDAFEVNPTLPNNLEMQSTLCLENSPSICVRSASGLAVEESIDGGETWATVYDVEQGGHLAHFTLGEFDDISQDASAVTELDNGSVVVVMGALEPAVRTADGVWGPDPARYRSPGVGAIVSIVLGAAALIAGAVLFAVRRRVVGVMVMIAALAPIGLAWAFWFVNDTFGIFLVPLLFGSFIVLIATPIAYVISVLTRNKKHPFKPATIALLVSPILLGFVPLLPLLLWRLDVTSSKPTGLLVLAVGAALAAAIGVTTKRVDGPEPAPPPPRVPPAPTLVPPAWS